MSASERLAKNRQALATLPRDTHPCLLVHCAAEAQDIDTLLDVAPRSARWAIAMRSRKQAIEDLRQVGPYLHRYSPERLGPLLDEWAGGRILGREIGTRALSHARALWDPTPG